MDIQHKDNGQKGIFYVVVNDKTEAEMTYVWSGDQRIIIDHTGVSEALKGEGIGWQLVHAAVVFARNLSGGEPAKNNASPLTAGQPRRTDC